MSKSNVVSFMEHKHKDLIETLETLLASAKEGRLSTFHAVYLEDGIARTASVVKQSQLILLRGMLAVAGDQIQGRLMRGQNTVH
jgi:hypothetical protein